MSAPPYSCTFALLYLFTLFVGIKNVNPVVDSSFVLNLQHCCILYPLLPFILGQLKKHIAIVLAGIFIVPMVFQWFHQMQHHSQQACCVLHCHSVAPFDGVFYVADDGGNEHCAVCEYHFSISGEPELPFFRLSVEAFIRCQPGGVPMRVDLQVDSRIRPRAPPAFS